MIKIGYRSTYNNQFLNVYEHNSGNFNPKIFTQKIIIIITYNLYCF